MSGEGGYLTTHVLDTARGAPAAGLRIELNRIGDDGPEPIRALVTNDDGRTNQPILSQEEFGVGVYELIFHAGAYLDSQSAEVAGPRFLDLIPIRFGIDDPSAHYHVPLLLSPFGYSTYRGS